MIIIGNKLDLEVLLVRPKFILCNTYYYISQTQTPTYFNRLKSSKFLHENGQKMMNDNFFHMKQFIFGKLQSG